MGLNVFTITDTNPNVAQGGGGCACSSYGAADCKPPFAVFHGADMIDPYSPHCVVCISCMKYAVDQAEDPEPQVDAEVTAEVVEEDGPVV